MAYMNYNSVSVCKVLLKMYVDAASATDATPKRRSEYRPQR